MWVWHAPIPYDWALASVPVYWLMELSLFLSAFAMWQRIFAARAGPALSALLGSIVQMGMLGALLTFAARPLYEPHVTTTLPFGLTPLGDQQLAGLLMWVPAALPYLAVALVDRLAPVRAADAVQLAGGRADGLAEIRPSRGDRDLVRRADLPARPLRRSARTSRATTRSTACRDWCASPMCR